jgi:aryl-alcohol dehydrogenase-like predicted oxidoreductase
MNTYFGKDNKEKYVNMFKELATISKELGCSQAALAMAWVLKSKDVSTAITGATKAE